MLNGYFFFPTTPITPLMPRSHQTSRSVLAVELLGIMLRNRWWPTTFLTITAGDDDGWMVSELPGVIGPSVRIDFDPFEKSNMFLWNCKVERTAYE